MLDAERIALSKYRLERAGEMLKTARRDLDAGDNTANKKQGQD